MKWRAIRTNIDGEGQSEIVDTVYEDVEDAIKAEIEFVKETNDIVTKQDADELGEGLQATGSIDVIRMDSYVLIQAAVFWDPVAGPNQTMDERADIFIFAEA